MRSSELECPRCRQRLEAVVRLKRGRRVSEVASSPQEQRTEYAGLAVPLVEVEAEAEGV